MIRWALFSTLAAGLFYGLYCLLLRRDRWLQLSRVYLLTTLAFSLLYPLVRMPEVELPLPTFGGDATLPMLEFTAEDTPTAEPTADMTAPRNGLKMLPIAYIIGVVVSLLVLAVQLLRTTISIRRVSSQARRQSIRLHLTDDATPPYSFFNHIVVGTNGLDEEQLQCILAHEELHVRQRHSVDVLLMRAMCCTAWFNPFAWLYVKELRAVHEYLADGAVLADHGREGYLGLLYREATGLGYGHITNNFQSINIKKRIAMMNRKKTRFGAWKLLAVLPVAAMLMLVGCKPANAAMTETQPAVRSLLKVSYNRSGGKKLAFGGVGYNMVCSNWDKPLNELSVTCQGEGVTRSYGSWTISDVETSKGVVDGRVLSRYERKMLKSIDRQLVDDGIYSGSICTQTRVKAPLGKVDLLCTATWENGTANGDADITFTVVEVGGVAAEITEEPDTYPEFVGGNDSLYHYMSANIHYPEQARKDGVQGRVFVRFVVEADGSISEAKVLRGISEECDAEALRVVQAMPRWKPGTKDGRPVRVQYNLPIVFKLNE